MKNTKLTVVVTVSLIAIIAVFWWAFGMRGEQGTGTNGQVVVPGTTTTEPSSAQPSASQPNIPVGTTQPKTQTSITITHPATGEKFVIGQNNLIQWSKEAGVAGSIYLVNNTDKSTVGWITSGVGVHQTSYTWNTRDVFLSLANPSKKDITPGTYIIKLKFDSARLADISSAPFQIIYPSQVEVRSYSVNIKNFVFLPDKITLKKGALLVFTNGDPVTHRIILQGFSPFTVASGGTLTFDTSVLAPSPYSFYSDVYSTMRLTVTVQ